MDYVIDIRDEALYKSKGKMTERLETFWNDFLNKLPDDLRKEALKRGFNLTRHEVDKDGKPTFYYNLKFDIPEASPKLRVLLDDYYNMENIIICMADPL